MSGLVHEHGRLELYSLLSICSSAPPAVLNAAARLVLDPKSLPSCLGHPCNSTLAASTTTSRLQGGRHGISCAAWFRATVPE